MNVLYKTNFKVLTPSNEEHWLTDGETFSKEVITPLNSDESIWQEVEVVKETSNSYETENESYSLEAAIKNKLELITAYDNSSAVNEFTFNGISFWLDKATRVGLVNSTNIAKALGNETTTLWLGTTPLTLPCDTVLNILYSIEMYALLCYNVTAAHKAVVLALNDEEAIDLYDYTQGYPDKLVFQ